MKNLRLAFLFVTLALTSQCGVDSAFVGADDDAARTLELEAADPLDPGQTLATDAESLQMQAAQYATELNVTEAVALARLKTLDRLHVAIDALEARDPAAFAGTFAGMQTSHDPFAITVSFKGPAPVGARELLTPVGDVKIDETAGVSEAEQRDAIDALMDELAAEYPNAQLIIGPGPSGGIEVVAAGLPALAPSAISAKWPSGLAVSVKPVPSIDLGIVDGAPEIDPTPAAIEAEALDANALAAKAATKCALRGGMTIDVSISASCTAGFGGTYCFPRGPLGCVPAIITAAHCPNKVSYPHCSNVQTLRLREQRVGPHGDWQSMGGGGTRKSTRFQIRKNETFATVRGRINSYGVGDIFHKFGRKSGNTFGKVTRSNVDVRMTNAATGATKLVKHLVEFKNPTHGWVCRPGDSGGPVYSGSKAAGVICGGSDEHSYFSPIRDLEKSLPNTFLNIRN